MIRRREVVTLFGGVAAPWPLAAWAQQAVRVRRVALLTNASQNDPIAGAVLVTAFQRRLQELGWIAGRNIQIESRFGGGTGDNIRPLAAELVALSPDVIVTSTTNTLQAVLLQTHSIPIVFYRVSDPLRDGFVASLAHPGGNVTGFAFNEFSASGKWLELLKEIAPNVSRVLVLLDPQNPTWRGYFNTIEAVAPALGVRVIATPVVDSAGAERAIADFGREPNGGLLVLPGPAIDYAAVASLAVRARLPASFSNEIAARNGGLVAYTPDMLDQIVKSAGYVDRILRGDKPADLPVQQPTKFELLINLKTAKAIGLAVPESLLARADEVIE
jgi:putative ABC transport system substrate-binding protein